MRRLADLQLTRIKLNLWFNSQTCKERLAIPLFLPDLWVQCSPDGAQPDNPAVRHRQRCANIVRVHADTVEIVLHLELVIRQTELSVFPPPLRGCL